MTGSVCTLSPDWTAYTAAGALAVGLLGGFLLILFSGKKPPSGEPKVEIKSEEEAARWVP